MIEGPVEMFPVLALDSHEVSSILNQAQLSHDRADWALATFSGWPTAMIFPPTHAQPGSLHYMFFPARACQEFHRHPGVRYLLLLGDVDMYVRFSRTGKDGDPTKSPETVVVPANTLAAVRFPAELWHYFETESDSGMGVLGLSFHDNDFIADPSTVSDDLMEELTVFWRDNPV